MKKTIMFSIALIFVWALLCPAVASPDTLALVVHQNAPTAAETTVVQYLATHDYPVSIVDVGEANIEYLTSFGTVILVEQDATLNSSLLSTLLTGGTNVGILYNATLLYAGEWTRPSDQNTLLVQRNQSYLAPYDQNALLTVQASGSHPALMVRDGGYQPPDCGIIPDWIKLGRSGTFWGGGPCGGNYNHDLVTSLTYGGGGGRGVIFTYDPTSFTVEGRELFHRMLKYITPSNTRLYLPSGIIGKNSTSSFPLVLGNVTNITDLIFNLSFDAQVLRFERIQLQEYLGDPEIQTQSGPSEGEIHITIRNVSKITIGEPQEIGYLLVTGLGEYEASSNLSANGGLWMDEDGLTFSMQSSDGKISIAKKGDLNTDGKVDWADVVMCAYMSWGLIPVDPAADFSDPPNGVDWGDVVKLAYYYWGLIEEL